MIITITGKPCSGKGTVSKLFCKQHNFEYICTGDMFRQEAINHGYETVLQFQQEYKDIKQIDFLIDSKIENLGKKRLQENIVIDSRLAWHFIPNSFKVFIDVDWSTAAERLIGAKRENENATDIETATELLINRWQVENNRYKQIYSTNNLNLDNYNLVINSSNKTPEQIVEIIYKEYQKFMQNA